MRRDATLQLDDLQKNELINPEDLYNIIYSGRASMPGFGEGCAPRGSCTFGKRLSDEQVKGLAEYVLDQAKNGWNISSD